MKNVFFLYVFAGCFLASGMLYAAAHPRLSREQDRRQRSLFHGAHKGILSDCQSALSARDKRNAISVDTRNEAGQTALMIAIRYNHIDVIKYLLKCGADVNAVDGTGWTPMAFAAKYAKPENAEKIFTLLLRYGARDMLAALDIASRNERAEVAAIIAIMLARIAPHQVVGPTR